MRSARHPVAEIQFLQKPPNVQSFEFFCGVPQHLGVNVVFKGLFDHFNARYSD